MSLIKSFLCRFEQYLIYSKHQDRPHQLLSMAHSAAHPQLFSFHKRIMLIEIETSILKRLETVRDALKPKGVLVRGLPDKTDRILQEDEGDIVAFIKGGNTRQVFIEINILLPTRVKNESACYPVAEQVWGLLHEFTPLYAAGPLTEMVWNLKIKDSRWLVQIDYKCAISPYVFGFDDDTLPGIEKITMMFENPTAPAFSVGSNSIPSL